MQRAGWSGAQTLDGVLLRVGKEPPLKKKKPGLKKKDAIRARRMVRKRAEKGAGKGAGKSAAPPPPVDTLPAAEAVPAASMPTRGAAPAESMPAAVAVRDINGEVLAVGDSVVVVGDAIRPATGAVGEVKSLGPLVQIFTGFAFVFYRVKMIHSAFWDHFYPVKTTI